MSRTLKRLQGLGAKVGAFALSGVLALSMTPAVALANSDVQGAMGEQSIMAQSLPVAAVSTSSADVVTAANESATLPSMNQSPNMPAVYDYDNLDKEIVAEYGDPLGDKKVEQVSESNENPKYRAYAHSDGSHYKAYSLYTELDIQDGVLTSIDLTSANDTFAGAWGYMTDSVEKVLPKDVSFKVTKHVDGTYTPELSGGKLDTYGYELSSITLYSTNADMTADSLGVDRSFGGTKTKVVENRGKTSTVVVDKYGSTSAKLSKDGKLTIPSAEVNKVTTSNGTVAETEETETVSDYYNLVQCTYTVGLGAKTGDKITFNAYFSVGAKANLANQYVESNVKQTSYKDTGYNQTNRDGWTGLMGTLVLRQLGSWNAHLQNEALSTGIDGELGGIDTVSGATKTSNAFLYALEKAYNDHKFTSVAEDVKVTIDGKAPNESATLETVDVNNNPQDGTTVVKNDDGTYTVNALHRQYGGGRLSLLNVYLYDLHGQVVGTTGVKALAKESYFDNEDAAYQYLRCYNDTDKVALADSPDGVTKLVSFGDSTKALTVLDKVNDEYASLSYENDGGNAGNKMPITLTVKSDKVTHVVFKYLLGHASFSIAYDLANMAEVPGVTKLLQSAQASDVSSVAKARAAYDALPYDVKPFTAGLATLKAAESSVDEASYKTALQEANQAIAKSRTIQSVTVAAGTYTYNGTAFKPAVTVNAANGDVVDSSHYTVEYANNINAGTATVTVKGAGAGGWTGEASETFTINPIEVAKPTAAALTYTGKEQTGVAKGAGYTVTGGSQTNAGTYEATATLDKNYAWTGGSTADYKVKFTIARAKVAKPTAKTGLTYTGKAQAAVTAAAGYTVTGGSNTNAGTYTATAKLDSNHAWADGTTIDLKVSYTIAKAASKVSLKAQSKTYTGKALKYSGKVTKSGSAGAVTYKYYSNAKCTKQVAASKVKAAGTYYVKATLAADANHASATSAAVKFTVKKASQTIKPAKTYTVKYSKVKKKAQTIAVKFKTNGGGKVTYAAAKSGKVSIAKNGKVTVKKGTAKKTYTLKVKVTAAAKGSYAKTTKTVNLKVKVA